MTPSPILVTRSGITGTGAAATSSRVDDATRIDQLLRMDDEEVFAVQVARCVPALAASPLQQSRTDQ